jgi:hypothetical protein
MKSKDILPIVINFFDFDITVKTRKRKVVYARAIFNKLSRKYTNDSLEEIGSCTVLDHAAVLHSLKELDKVYIYQDEPFNVKESFNSLDNLISKFSKQIKQIEKAEMDKLLYYEKSLYDTNLKLYNIKNQLKLTQANLNYYRRKNSSIDKKFIGVLDVIKKFNDDELLEFQLTRLEPYKKMLLSKNNNLKRAS